MNLLNKTVLRKRVMRTKDEKSSCKHYQVEGAVDGTLQRDGGWHGIFIQVAVKAIVVEISQKKLRREGS
jgi:hypothetical protein